MAGTRNETTTGNMWSGVPIAPANAFVPQLNNPFTISRQQHTQQHHQPTTASTAQEQMVQATAEQNLGFPVRLHYMLTDIHKDGSQTHIVSWQPHGRYV